MRRHLMSSRSSCRQATGSWACWCWGPLGFCACWAGAPSILEWSESVLKFKNDKGESRKERSKSQKQIRNRKAKFYNPKSGMEGAIRNRKRKMKKKGGVWNSWQFLKKQIFNLSSGGKIVFKQALRMFSHGARQETPNRSAQP